jgi:hypothetical protein
MIIISYLIVNIKVNMLWNLLERIIPTIASDESHYADFEHESDDPSMVRDSE